MAAASRAEPDGLESATLEASRASMAAWVLEAVDCSSVWVGRASSVEVGV